MKMVHSTEISITDGIAREDLQQFIDAVPAAAKIIAEVEVQKADRPYESGRTLVKLQAKWMT